MKFNRLTRLQDLERRVFHLEQLLAGQGVTVTTIEQAIRAYFRGHSVGDAPAIALFARDQHELMFKTTSVSATLCKLVRLGVIQKHRRNHMAFDTYSLKEKRS